MCVCLYTGREKEKSLNQSSNECLYLLHVFLGLFLKPEMLNVLQSAKNSEKCFFFIRILISYVEASMSLPANDQRELGGFEILFTLFYLQLLPHLFRLTGIFR